MVGGINNLHEVSHARFAFSVGLVALMASCPSLPMKFAAHSWVSPEKQRDRRRRPRTRPTVDCGHLHLDAETQVLLGRKAGKISDLLVGKRVRVLFEDKTASTWPDRSSLRLSSISIRPFWKRLPISERPTVSTWAIWGWAHEESPAVRRAGRSKWQWHWRYFAACIAPIANWSSGRPESGKRLPRRQYSCPTKHKSHATSASSVSTI